MNALYWCPLTPLKHGNILSWLKSVFVPYRVLQPGVLAPQHRDAAHTGGTESAQGE